VLQRLKAGSLGLSNISCECLLAVSCGSIAGMTRPDISVDGCIHVSWQTTESNRYEKSSKPISCCAIFKEQQVTVWCSGSCKAQFEFWHMPTLLFRTCPMRVRSQAGRHIIMIAEAAPTGKQNAAVQTQIAKGECWTKDIGVAVISCECSRH
jgi:hypothetical protein